MKTSLLLFCFALCALFLASCSSVTMLRTKEIKESTGSVNKRIDSLMQVIDSLKFEQDRSLSRLKADFAELNSKIDNQGNQAESRMEEITFRLDHILRLTQQKTMVTKSAASGKKSKDSDSELQSREMEGLYNTSRSDYLRGEYAVAYNGFKQIYETVSSGEMAENALYWMGMCMLDAGKKENAETLFKSLLEKFPQSPKVCTVNFKLAGMAEEKANTTEQRAYLQKLLGTKHCVSSNEFQRAADILQGN